MENIKLYKCSFCPASFFTDQERKQHEDICGKSEEERFNEIIKLCPNCIKPPLSYKIKMKLTKIPNYPDRWVCQACNYEKLA